MNFFSSCVHFVGAILRLMHFHGANPLLIVGLSSVAVGALMKYASQLTVQGIVTGIAIAAICIIALFKLMHWGPAF